MSASMLLNPQSPHFLVSTSGLMLVLTLFHACCSKVVRKSVARVLTVISQEQKKALREVYKNKVGTW